MSVPFVNKMKIFSRLFSIKDKPQNIAKGYAMGIFLATTPFVGIKVFIALLLTTLFNWNRKASIIGVYHVNALTAPIFYSIAFIIGKAVLGIHTIIPALNYDFRSMLDLFFGGANIFWAFLTGGLILGFPLSYAAYIISNYALVKKQIDNRTADQPFDSVS